MVVVVPSDALAAPIFSYPVVFVGDRRQVADLLKDCLDRFSFILCEKQIPKS